jgi:hypothetical protein
MYDLLDTIDHPESLTVEEAFELASLVSIATCSSELSTGELFSETIVNRMGYDEIEYLDKRVRNDRVLKNVVKTHTIVKRSAGDVHRPHDHSRCSVCELNRTVEWIIHSGRMKELDRTEYADLKNQLEIADGKLNEDPSRFNTLTVKALTDKINNVLNKLTSSIGEHHAQ